MAIKKTPVEATIKPKKTKRITSRKEASKTVAKAKSNSAVLSATTRKRITTKKTPTAKSVKVQKNTSTKNASKSVIKKTPAKKSAAKKVVDDIEKAPVVLPKNMSLRAVEKTYVLKREFDFLFQQSAFKIAYVSGFCMLLVGAAYLAPNYVSSFKPNYQSAAIASSVNSAVTNVSETVTSVDETVASVNGVVTGVGETTFQLTTNIPGEVTKNFAVSFSAANVDLAEAKLVREGHVGYIDLQTQITSNNNYRFVIPTESLSPDYYSVRIYIKPANGGKAKVYETRKFFASIGGIVESPEPVESADGKTATQLISPTDNTDNPDSAGSLVPIEQSGTIFAIFNASGNVLSNTATIGISSPVEYTYLELYLRPVQSLNSRFVTLATKRFEKWQFVFDTTNIPNGKYELFAQTKLDSKVIESTPILVSVYNGAKANSIVSVRPVSTDARDFVKFDNDYFSEDPTTADTVKLETNILLTKNSADLNNLLRNYAVAIQSGDEMLIRTAKSALQSKKDEIIIASLNDERIQGISDNINTELDTRIEEIQKKVEVFEGIRRDRTNGDSALDTDKDGITDFDEINIFKTNPDLSDTDNDGVTDGVEITRGYDPNNSKSEAIITFESPKESLGLVQDEIIKISEVTPVIKVGEEEVNEGTTATEIRGYSLPNSFVTLYIYSSPTVVTIKTDADGSYVYTFDKELEDGRHDVYAAITDNAGDIIAQSNPFSFIKQAQAFTPVDAEEAEVISPDSVVTVPKEAYSAVAGMGILALGVILIMLGISLRGKKEDEVEKNEEADNTLE